jgi:hypothetical protein
MLAVGDVSYSCPQLDGQETWTPGVFTVELVAEAGEACCRGEGRATASVTITDRPTLAILAPTAPVTICEDSQEPYVKVEFTVDSNTPDPINLPATITPRNTGSRDVLWSDCVPQDSTGNCEWGGCCANAECCDSAFVCGPS